MAVDVLIPPLGTNTDTLILVEWFKREGEAVVKDEPLFSVETDKSTLEVEAPASGVLRGVTASAGDEVTALSRVAVLVADGEAWEAQLAAPKADVAAAPVAAAKVEAAPVATAHDRFFVSPRAKRLAESRAIDWRTLTGTGPEGAVVERDVRAVEGGGERVARERIRLSGARAVIAQRMHASAQTTAPVTLTSEVDATELVAWRARLKGDGLAVSYNDLLLAILAVALREHPRMNASLDGDTIAVWEDVNIGLAVDGDGGLRVPVVRNVDTKGLAQIAEETAALVDVARQGKATPEQLRGGTFTLTNLGMFGIDAFTPIVNLPEAALLGVGRIQATPAVVDGRIEVRQKMWLSLTFDHRLIDGGPAARFLQRVAQCIESPPEVAR